MTEGHTHWVITVPQWVSTLLRKSIWWSSNINQVDKSPYPYSPCLDHEDCQQWYLSTLSILHRWTGLTLDIKENDE